MNTRTFAARSEKGLSSKLLFAAFFLFLSMLPLLFQPTPALGAWSGGHDVSGSGEGRKTWYFAEGCTRLGFEEWVCLMNPNDVTATANCSYILGDGQVIIREETLPPRSRITVNVRAVIPPDNDVSLAVESSQNILVERPMYFRYHNDITGGHDVMGAETPRNEWYFAEGCSRDGFDTWLCLQNPGDEAALYDISYYCGDGAVEERKDLTLGPHSRFTIPVHEPGLGLGRFNDAHGDFSIAVRTTNNVPLVVERPMYFRYHNDITGGHDVMGAETPRNEWYFAEGCSRDGFDTWLCLQNPGDEAALYDISYYCGDGAVEERKDLTLGPHSRFTIPVHEPGLGLGRFNDAHGDFSIAVRTTNNVPLVVERPMYFRYHNDITGGHDVMGAETPRNEWYFAEGCSRDGFDTWLCLQNPGDEAALYDISYYCGDGAVEERKDLTLGPHSRFTIPVHEPGLGLGRFNDAHGDFSIAVRTTNNVPLVVERPMYFRYHSILPEWQSVDRIALAQSLGWQEIFNGNVARRCVALTFDVEGDPTATAVILDILATYDVQCTFFVLGTFADTYPGLVKRMVDEGHEVGSHSYSHAQFTSSSPNTRYSEIVMADTAISRATGYSPKPYFRFPYGLRNSAALSQLNSLGYLNVYWNVDPSDYTGISSGTLYARVMSDVRPGAIVVMHALSASQKASALPAIIRDLRASGYELCTVTEALLAED